MSTKNGRSGTRKVVGGSGMGLGCVKAAEKAQTEVLISSYSADKH